MNRAANSTAYTVDDQYLPAYVLTSCACEKDDRPRQIARGAPTSSGDAFGDLAETNRVIEETRVPGRWERQSLALCRVWEFAVKKNEREITLSSRGASISPRQLSVLGW